MMKDLRALYMMVSYIVILPLVPVIYGGLYIFLRIRLGANHYEAKMAVLRTLLHGIEMNIEFIKYGFKNTNRE